jgi:hypothetical protein
MRVVDEETRRIIQQNRIDALEADNLFDNLRMEEEDEDDGQDEVWDDYGAGAGGSGGSDQDDQIFKTTQHKKGRKDAVHGPSGVT